MESLRVAALFLRNHLPDIVVVSTSAGMGACRRTLRFIGDALAAARTEYPIPEDEMREPASYFTSWKRVVSSSMSRPFVLRLR